MAFRRDNRAVSQVVGFILLFALIVILFSLYQAQIVPSENAQTEYQHSQTVQTDMLELRNALLTANSQGRTQFVDIQLGTQYEPRTIALNPPAATGTLETSEPHPIIIRNETGSTVSNVCPAGTSTDTRILTYTPSYSEYDDAPSIVYENTVLYLQFDNRTVPLSSQRLVTNDGNIVRLSPLNSSLSITTSRTIAIEAIPGQRATAEVENGEFTTPTRLSESTWEDLLAGQVSASNVSVSANNLTVQTSGTIDITCAPIGVNDPPAGGERASESLGVNPTSSVQVRAFNRPSNDVVEVVFNNTASQDINATKIRLPFYHNPSDQGGEIGPIEVIDPATGDTAATLDVLGDFNTLDPKIRFAGNDTETTVTVRNTGGEKFDSRDFFVLEITFSNGQTGTYFVDIPA